MKRQKMRLSEKGLFIVLITIYFGTVYTNNTSRSGISINGLHAFNPDGFDYGSKIPFFLAGKSVNVILIGNELTADARISVTTMSNSCKSRYEAKILVTYDDYHAAFISTNVNYKAQSEFYECYLCVKVNNSWIHQGTEIWKIFKMRNSQIWPQITLLIVSIFMSAMVSGIYVALMALDSSELTVISRSNLGKEKLYAKRILTVRDEGNFLLCSILFTSTTFNTILTMTSMNLIKSMFSGAMIVDVCIVILVTMITVIFCQIVPQAASSRIPLWVGAKTIFFTTGFMIVTTPFSYPLGKLLDYILGREIIRYPKERLKELIKISELKKAEASIIAGTLEMSKTQVGEIMTLLEDVYELPITGFLDYQTVSNIMFSGHSRIPIYEGDSKNIVHVVLTKDMAIIDPSDKIPILTLCEYSSCKYKYLPYETTLDVAFRDLKEDNLHIAFITKKDENNTDVVVGLVTLEDILEEMIQEEIFDETDMFVDNPSKRRRKISSTSRKRKIIMMLKKYGAHSVTITPQMKSAAYNFLTSAVEPFKSDKITEEILWKLLNLVLVERIHPREGYEDADIYVKGKEVDFFVMILEGKVQVSIGKEDLIFEGGPFHCFGHLALTNNIDEEEIISNLGCFTPDYSVTAISEVLYLKIERTFYLAALKASELVPVNEELIINKNKFNIFLSMLEKVGSEDESREDEGREDERREDEGREDEASRKNYAS